MKVAREYQNNAIGAVIKSSATRNTGLLILATGLGKTFCAVKIAEHFKKTLFIVDREELCEQAALAFLRDKFDQEIITKIEETGFIKFMHSGKNFDFLTTDRVGLIKADAFQLDGSVVFASVQTLIKRLHLLSPDLFDLVVVDEAHNYMAQSYHKAVCHFTPKLRLGLTATGFRSDGLQLSDLFDGITYEYGISDGIKDGYLVELDAIKIKTNVSLDKVRTTGGELNAGDLEDEINTLTRNNEIANSYLKYCKDRQTIVFCVSIRHAIDLCEAFKEKGINADVVSSDEKQTGDRREKVKKFKAGEITVIVNVGILTTGFDSPEVSCLIMARPTKSLTLFMQMVGRGTRTLAGVIDELGHKEYRWKAIKASKKRETIILDIIDNTSRHNLVNCFTIDAGKDPDDRIFITDEKRQKLNEARLQRSAPKITHVQKEDERITLIAIPKIKISNSFRMSEHATQAQLDVIEKWGYPVKDIFYTKAQAAEIFANQPCSDKHRNFLSFHGYDVSGFISVAQAAAASKEIEERKIKFVKR